MRPDLAKLGLGSAQFQTGEGGTLRGRSAEAEAREMLATAARAGLGFLDAGAASPMVEQMLGAAAPRPLPMKLLVKSVRGDRGPDIVEDEARASLARLGVQRAQAIVVQTA